MEVNFHRKAVRCVSLRNVTFKMCFSSVHSHHIEFCSTWSSFLTVWVWKVQLLEATTEVASVLKHCFSLSPSCNKVVRLSRNSKRAELSQASLRCRNLMSSSYFTDEGQCHIPHSHTLRNCFKLRHVSLRVWGATHQHQAPMHFWPRGLAGN